MVSVEGGFDFEAICGKLGSLSKRLIYCCRKSGLLVLILKQTPNEPKMNGQRYEILRLFEIGTYCSPCRRVITNPLLFGDDSCGRTRNIY